MEEMAQEKKIGLVGRMLRVFYAPAQTFEGVRRQHSWLDWFVPTLVVIIATVFSSNYIMPIFQLQLENTPAGMPEHMWIVNMLALPVTIFTILFSGGLFIFLGVRFALGCEVSYAQMLAVFAYTSLLTIAELGLGALFYLGRLDATISLGLLLPEDMLKTFVGQFINGLTPFTLWRIYLVAIAITVIGNLAFRKAAISALVLWILWLFILLAIYSNN